MGTAVIHLPACTPTEFSNRGKERRSSGGTCPLKGWWFWWQLALVSWWALGAHCAWGSPAGAHTYQVCSQSSLYIPCTAKWVCGHTLITPLLDPLLRNMLSLGILRASLHCSPEVRYCWYRYTQHRFKLVSSATNSSIAVAAYASTWIAPSSPGTPGNYLEPQVHATASALPPLSELANLKLGWVCLHKLLLHFWIEWQPCMESTQKHYLPYNRIVSLSVSVRLHLLVFTLDLQHLFILNRAGIILL